MIALSKLVDVLGSLLGFRLRFQRFVIVLGPYLDVVNPCSKAGGISRFSSLSVICIVTNWQVLQNHFLQKTCYCLVLLLFCGNRGTLSIDTTESKAALYSSAAASLASRIATWPRSSVSMSDVITILTTF